MRNRNIFQQFWWIRKNYNPKPIPTCCDKSDVLPRDELTAVSSAQIAVLHRKLSGRQLKQKKKEIDQDIILKYFRVNSTLRRWLVLLNNTKSSTTKKWFNKKKHLTINTVKLNFVEKASSLVYDVKRHLKYQSISPSSTTGVEHSGNPISLNHQQTTSTTK